MVAREIPVFVYWNGCIKDGPDGPYYEGSTLRAIRVKRNTKFMDLVDELYRVTKLDKQQIQVGFICRYPSIVQQTMVKYLRLPVVDDSCVETMLEIPSLHPSVSNVELYLEVKPVSSGVSGPITHSSATTSRGDDTCSKNSSLRKHDASQRYCQEEAVGVDLGLAQEMAEAQTDNDVQLDNEFSEDDGNNEANSDTCRDAGDVVGGEATPLHALRDTEANSSGEIVPVNSRIDGGNSNNPKPLLPTMTWLQDRELRKGMVFKDSLELKKFVKLYSIKRQREFEVEGAGKNMYTVRCTRRKEAECRWRLRAVKLKRHGLFEITKYSGPHTCVGPDSSQKHRQLDVGILAEEIESLIKAEPSMPIAELIWHVKEKFGFTVGYGKMWFARQKAIAKAFGDWDGSFKVLPKFMAVLKKSNGTIMDGKFFLLPDPTTASFRRLFWTFSQSIKGFEQCRPLISIDAADLNGKYNGKMMIAIGIDANEQLFPLAFAITEEESSDSWCWFLTRIREKVTQREGVCLISSPHPDVISAVNQAGSQWQEPWAYHRFCAKHLCNTFNDEFHNRQLKGFVYKAACARRVGKFDSYMGDIEKINPEAHRWLVALPLAQWALVHDNGHRYGVMTTNLSEVFSTVLKGARDLPITSCVQLTFDRLKILFDARRVEADESLNRGNAYASHVMTKLQEHVTSAETYNVTPLDQTGGPFEVVTQHEEHIDTRVGGKKHVVELRKGTCTCGKWQVYKFPCSHVLAVCKNLQIDGWQYIEDCYTIEKYLQTYKPQFSSLPEEADWPESSEIPILYPDPNSRRSEKGRPATVRLRNESNDFKCGQRVLRCGTCGREGHTRRTCGRIKG